jgi:hypothetical protein
MSQTAQNGGAVLNGFPAAFMGRVLDAYGEWLRLSFDLGQQISNELWDSANRISQITAKQTDQFLERLSQTQ